MRSLCPSCHAKILTPSSASAAKCVNLEVPPGTTLSYDQIKEAVVQHKPAVLFLCQVRSRLLQVSPEAPFLQIMSDKKKRKKKKKKEEEEEEEDKILLSLDAHTQL